MLIICSECKKEYSDQAKNCPHCGAITSQNKYISSNMRRNYNDNFNQNNNISSNGCGVVLMIIIALILTFVGAKLFFGILGSWGINKDTITSTFKEAWEENTFWADDTSSNSSFFSDDRTYNVGEKITTDKFEITVTNVEEKSTISSSSGSSSAGDDNTFVCVKLKIKNICGKSLGIISHPTFNLVDSKDISYYQEFLASLQYLVEVGAGNQPDLDPGVTIYDVGVFKIDKKYYDQNSFNLKISADETILVKIK